jgi:anti-sigma factor ChrR (cupin superfamily)
MSYEDLPCQEFVELATGYLEGTLPAGQRLVVELHLVYCTHCVDYLDQMRVTLRMTGELRQDDVPALVMDALAEAFRTLSGGSG